MQNTRLPLAVAIFLALLASLFTPEVTSAGNGFARISLSAKYFSEKEGGFTADFEADEPFSGAVLLLWPKQAAR